MIRLKRSKTDEEPVGQLDINQNPSQKTKKLF